MGLTKNLGTVTIVLFPLKWYPCFVYRILFILREEKTKFQIPSKSYTEMSIDKPLFA